MRFDGVGMIVAPRSETEYAVTALWAEVLGRRPQSIDDDFHGTGAPQEADRLLAAVGDRWKITVTRDEFKAAPSIARLSALVERKVIEARTRDNALLANVLDELDSWNG